MLTFLEVVHDVVCFHIEICLLKLNVLSELLHDMRFGASGCFIAQKVGLLLRDLAEGDLGMPWVEIYLLGLGLLVLCIVD